MVAMVAGMGEGQDGWIGLNPAGEGETLRRGDQGEAKGQDGQGQARTGKDRQGQARTGKDRQGQARQAGWPEKGRRSKANWSVGRSGYETQDLRRGNARNGHEIERMNAGRQGCFRTAAKLAKLDRGQPADP